MQYYFLAGKGDCNFSQFVRRGGGGRRGCEIYMLGIGVTWESKLFISYVGETEILGENIYKSSFPSPCINIDQSFTDVFHGYF